MAHPVSNRPHINHQFLAAVDPMRVPFLLILYFFCRQNFFSLGTSLPIRLLVSSIFEQTICLFSLFLDATRTMLSLYLSIYLVCRLPLFPLLIRINSVFICYSDIVRWILFCDSAAPTLFSDSLSFYSHHVRCFFMIGPAFH